MSNAPVAKHRLDYQPPMFTIDTVDLKITLGEALTTVESTLAVRRLGKDKSAPLVLNGEHLTLEELKVDGQDIDYTLTPEHLSIATLPDSFELFTHVTIDPENNTRLQGLYHSGDIYCTQCEAEGFRSITYFIDRPDILSTYTTTIIGDKTLHPVLLSNGNRIDARDIDHNQHFAIFHDPHNKPCYLFALVAGNLAVRTDLYFTSSGRDVALEIYAAPNDIDKCHWAMESLKNSMRWDEETYGLECDLDRYAICAAADFNMGAMENKGLNIFNTKYVLSEEHSATDADLRGIEKVIGHEYFHNWTGNRVTCRDWFQLSLKEGLTVFRDQQFSQSLNDPTLERIEEVKIIRQAQFAEDASPMRHPIRPESYIEMNNFYTVTVYNKGAEVIRMMNTLVGQDGFRAGMDLYFNRHDGQAVTCEDFVRAIEDANQIDLNQFRLWYSQAGTPEITVDQRFDAEKNEFYLTLSQQAAPDNQPEDYESMLIPVVLALFTATGEPITCDVVGGGKGHEHSLEFFANEQTFVFKDIEAMPLVSLFRRFSAPVKVHDTLLSTAERIVLSQKDSCEFNRWDAHCQIMVDELLALAQDNSKEPASEIIAVFAYHLEHGTNNLGLLAEFMTLPSEATLAEHQSQIDVDALISARKRVKLAIAKAHETQILACYQHYFVDNFEQSREARGQRALACALLQLLLALGKPEYQDLALKQLESQHMGLKASALMGLCCSNNDPLQQNAIDTFHQQHGTNPLLLDKWLRAQALSTRTDTLDRVKALSESVDFDLHNPNKVYALLGAFTHNWSSFHQANGESYAFIAEKIAELDAFNPHLSARLLQAMMRWCRFDPARQKLMRGHLEKLLNKPKLSKDAYEVISKSLEPVGVQV